MAVYCLQSSLCHGSSRAGGRHTDISTIGVAIPLPSFTTYSRPGNRLQVNLVGNWGWLWTFLDDSQHGPRAENPDPQRLGGSEGHGPRSDLRETRHAGSGGEESGEVSYTTEL